MFTKLWCLWIFYVWPSVIAVCFHLTKTIRQYSQNLFRKLQCLFNYMFDHQSLQSIWIKQKIGDVFAELVQRHYYVSVLFYVRPSVFAVDMNWIKKLGPYSPNLLSKLRFLCFECLFHVWPSDFLHFIPGQKYHKCINHYVVAGPCSDVCVFFTFDYQPFQFIWFKQIKNWGRIPQTCSENYDVCVF